MEVWECDLVDLQSLAKYNDMHRYIICNRYVYEIYVSGPRKDKERPIYRLSVSVHISRLARPCVDRYRQGQRVFK